MLTQAGRYELKRHITDILTDTGLPPHLKVNRLADLLEDHFISSGLETSAFEDALSHFLPPAQLRERKSPARQQSPKRKNATSARASAST